MSNKTIRRVRLWYYGRIGLAKRIRDNKILGGTWRLSIPDGKGHVTNSWGRWINGERFEEGREVILDLFYFYRIPYKNYFHFKSTRSTGLPKVSAGSPVTIKITKDNHAT